MLSDRVGDKPGEVEQYALFYRSDILQGPFWANLHTFNPKFIINIVVCVVVGHRPTVAKVLRAEHYPDDLDIYSRVPFLTEIKFRVPGE